MMKKKALKIFLIFSITFSFAQNYTPLNLSIKGMHCACLRNEPSHTNLHLEFWAQLLIHYLLKRN